MLNSILNHKHFLWMHMPEPVRTPWTNILPCYLTYLLYLSLTIFLHWIILSILRFHFLPVFIDVFLSFWFHIILQFCSSSVHGFFTLFHYLPVTNLYPILWACLYMEFILFMSFGIFLLHTYTHFYEHVLTLTLYSYSVSPETSTSFSLLTELDIPTAPEEEISLEQKG